jgi:MoaA/NifB/PqqE/SkfB family radical SAM enzyme
MEIKLPKNLCLAPFAYLTFDPAKNVSPCPALGGSLWKFPGKSLEQIWEIKELTDFRNTMLEDQKHKVCARCWDEESLGMSSERTMLWNPDTDPTGMSTNILESKKTPVQVLADYKRGPMQLAIKVGNVCNLRCRSCNSVDSVTLSAEGRYYKKHYGLTNEWYLKETKTKVFTDQQITEIATMCANVQRIEFYGGEPLLDKQLPNLLRQLSVMGLSNNIDINISTNLTQPLTDELVDILKNYRSLNLSLSMDGWGDKFTYLRHPGDWASAYNNVRNFIKLALSRKIPLSLRPVITVTIMNVHHLPELVANIKRYFGLTPFLILARYPGHYNIRNIPENISNELIKNLQQVKDFDFSAIIEALRKPGVPELWDEFKQWTAIIDDYRKESFVETFTDYTELIRKYEPNFLIKVAKDS